MAEIAPYTQQPSYSFDPNNPDFTGYDIDNMLALIREIAAKYPNIKGSDPATALSSLKNLFSFKLSRGARGRNRDNRSRKCRVGSGSRKCYWSLCSKINRATGNKQRTGN